MSSTKHLGQGEFNFLTFGNGMDELEFVPSCGYHAILPISVNTFSTEMNWPTTCGQEGNIRFQLNIFCVMGFWSLDIVCGHKISSRF